MADTHPLELLAPAKTAEIGIAAVNHGADAVYIGGPAFGARAAAGNTLEEIERLVRHAHLFHARVYIALNTLFDDAELEQAAALAHSLWNLGADALIIQDMGLLECDLPSIPLHASTQCDLRSAEKAAFLQGVGFRQLVLARELTLAEIAEVRAATTVPLEFFIHGALCVSYSGQCYISEVLTGRSANRGACAQFCRHRYSLQRESGDEVAGGYLLSLQDLNLSGRLQALVEAGISSFKIEGRLKDAGYVKNVTASYRRELDAILEGQPGRRASAGRCVFDFAPTPGKSFHRGGTDYCLGQRRNRSAEIRTPKATGERLGKVVAVRGKGFQLDGGRVSAGDGLCWFRGNELHGLRVNQVEGEWLVLRESVEFAVGTVLHRQVDTSFQRELERSQMPRTLRLTMVLRRQAEGLQLILTDEEGVRSETLLKAQFEAAKQPGQGNATARKQLVRLGGTFFTAGEIEVQLCGDPFLPASLLNELRRTAVSRHEELRREEHPREVAQLTKNSVPWPKGRAGVLENICNSRAAAFYIRHGAEVANSEVAVAAESGELPLMRTRYCIKYQLGLCPRKGRGVTDKRMILEDERHRLEVEFDCSRCEMTIWR